MKIGFEGMGRLGLPVAYTFASKGHEVYGYDINDAVYDYVEKKQYPLQEDELPELMDEYDVTMVKNLGELVANCDLIMVPIQTPHSAEYEGITRLPETRKDFDYTWLKDGVGQLAVEAAKQQKDIDVAIISTTLPGTINREIKPLLNEYTHLAYEPMFIAMGTVVRDVLDPEFTLIGVDEEEVAGRLEEFYKTIHTAPVLKTDITTAEGIKVAYNTFITMKTVLGNTWGELSHKLGMNVDDIYKAWSFSDKRLMSPRYLKSGVGDGGGCHPRDNIALSYLATQHNLSHNLFEDLMKSREEHMAWLGDVAVDVANVTGNPIVVLGRSFKPETNIETGSPALLMVNMLKDRYGVEVTHVEDTKAANPCVFILGTAHERYKTYDYPEGSTVIDPFGIVEDREKIDVVRIGRP